MAVQRDLWKESDSVGWKAVLMADEWASQSAVSRAGLLAALLVVSSVVSLVVEKVVYLVASMVDNLGKTSVVH